MMLPNIVGDQNGESMMMMMMMTMTMTMTMMTVDKKFTI
jgi:hypothetical protein